MAEFDRTTRAEYPIAEDLNSKPGKALHESIGQRGAGADEKPLEKAAEDTLPGDFAKLKLSVIRPVFENVGNQMKARGHEFSISEEPGGKISIHIVPTGVNKSLHPYDGFPTLSIFAAPLTRTIALHGRNARRNSSGGSGQRGEYTLPQVSKKLVENELTTFIGEIANW